MSSKLSDYYNSLDEATPKQDRTKHEFFAEHIGFGWEHSASARGQIPAEVAVLQKVVDTLYVDTQLSHEHLRTYFNVYFCRKEVG